MIDHLISYLRAEIPDYSDIILKDVIDPDSLQSFILVIDNGGTFNQVQNLRTDREFQIVTQATDSETAKELSLDVFNLIGQIYGLELPAPTGKEETESPIQTASIKASRLPEPLGNIGNGLYRYQTNYIVIGEK